jgi:aspartate 1-decarboxylase
MSYCELEPQEIPGHKPVILVMNEDNDIINRK